MQDTAYAVEKAWDALTSADYKIAGDAKTWVKVLSKFSDAQIETAVDDVISSFTYTTVKVAVVADRARSDDHSYHGAGGQTLSNEFEMWQDSQGRNYGYHPSMARFALNEEQTRAKWRDEEMDESRLIKGDDDG